MLLNIFQDYWDSCLFPMGDYSFIIVLSLPVALCLWGLSRRVTLLWKVLPPGPSLLTRILERNSGEPLATKLERWSHQYGKLLL